MFTGFSNLTGQGSTFRPRVVAQPAQKTDVQRRVSKPEPPKKPPGFGSWSGTSRTSEEWNPKRPRDPIRRGDLSQDQQRTSQNPT